jgi:catechol 2,3-dioxygenase-like lactoylglutathione lyase family enzyme
MEFGSINLAVKDPDAALETYLKLFGTNNVPEVIKLKGLNDTVDTVDGYYLKTKPVNLGIFRPRESAGRMGKFLEKYGEGIHHIALHLGQDEFEQTYSRFKDEGLRVSDNPVYIGKFSEAVFWLEESNEQGVPVKFATKMYHGSSMWQDIIYLDTPQKFEKVTITEEYPMPRVNLGTIMVTVKEWKKQQQIWANILSQSALDIGNLATLEEASVDDRRGNIFIPIKHLFPGGGAINLYCALNDDAPINKVMASRGRTVMYHNICGYVTRDKVHEYWRRLDENGFAMVDPKPLLNAESGNGNYFYFVHPISTHGVLYEIVSAYVLDETKGLYYDWSDTKTYMVPPEINPQLKTA